MTKGRPLSDQQCRAAQARDKPYRLSDGLGLNLLVSTSGAKLWRLKYRFGGKEKQLSFGQYPEVSLKAAREKTLDARQLLRDGIDPGERRRRHRILARSGIPQNETFEGVARAWHARQKSLWKDKHAKDVMDSLELDLFPAFGKRALVDIRSADLRKVLMEVQRRGATEKAHRLLQRITAIFTYAGSLEMCESNPALVVKAALAPVRKGRQPALIRIEDCRAFLTVYEAQPGYPLTRLASRLLAATAVRAGCIYPAEITEFEDLDGSLPIWRIPAHKLKLGKEKSERAEYEFVVPLSRQAVAIVKTAVELGPPRRRWLFCSQRWGNRPMTNNALNVAYRRVPGFAGRHVPHGWRSSFSTIMNERAIDAGNAGDNRIIELMLGHELGGVEGRYNRAAYMARRRELSQEWADLLFEGIGPPEDLIDLPYK